MKINYMRAACTLACSTYAYDAEMKVEIDNNKVLFLHANYSDSEHFTVAEKSFFEFMVGEESEMEEGNFLEEYESLKDTYKSTYYKLFQALDAFTDYYMRWRETSGDEWLLKVEDQSSRKKRNSENYSCMI